MASGASAERAEAAADADHLRSGRIPDPQPEHTPLFRWLARTLGTIEQFLRARGGKPLRTGIRWFWGALALVGIFLLIGPVLNKPMDFDEVIDSASVADVDWVARDAAIDYTVDREPDGTFSTRVTERFQANFVNGPEREVVRTLVTEVHGKNAEFVLVGASVDGEAAATEVTRHPTTTDITIGAPGGERLEGEREIELSYELHHLARAVTDSATGELVDEWDWPLFAPSWPQATKGLAVSVTLPTELDEALVRQPFASVGWLLVRGNVWLTPDETTAESVRYAFENDDSLPPNSDVWVEFSFEHGTFAEPPKTALFWVQTWGPLLPLAALVVLMLFALAARWIVWADSAGEPWFLPRAEPPTGLDPVAAAEMLEKPRHAELVAALSAPDAGTRSERWLRSVARAGRRSGRAGNLPAVERWRSRWARTSGAVEQGLRWAPDSYVRDTFLLAPIAVTLLQWGLLRQLSHQVILLVVWWPALFVLAATIISAVALWAVARPRPLTRKGALAKQQLRGIDAYARATRLLERGPVDDALLPYAVLFESPRRAGNAVTQHAVRESGDRGLLAGWRGEHFLSVPSLLSFVAAGALFAGSIVVASTQPAPYSADEFLTWPSSEARGATWTQLEGFDISAELARDAAGGARLEVTEQLTVGFEPGGASVPQFEREWPSERLGQPLGLEVEAISVDGESVPFAQTRGKLTTKVTTKLSEVLAGKLPVEVRYSFSSPVVEVQDGSGVAQQLRWAALLRFWDDTFFTEQSKPFDGSDPVRPIRVQLTVAKEIAAELRSGGWIDHGDAPKQPGESGTGFTAWAAERDMYNDSGRIELRVGAEQKRSDGALVAVLDIEAVESRPAPEPGADAADAEPFAVDAELNGTLGQHELGATGDLGAVLNFSAGTFTNVTDGAAERYRVEHGAPLGLLIGFTVLVLIACAAVFVVALRGGSRLGLSALLISFGTLTLLAVAQSIVFWWVTGSMPGSSGAVGGLIALSTVMWVALVAQWIAVVRGGKTT
ncbi:DUF2207 domain-containing protein [Leucobacter albus]|uniref:DUF2207 domain-containing protein n=1 Tax=Leucobacter albus TaxID=272210 RepID=A0ABW3TLQ2_9MICO